jgi:hypothetical protein
MCTLSWDVRATEASLSRWPQLSLTPVFMSEAPGFLAPTCLTTEQNLKLHPLVHLSLKKDQGNSRVAGGKFLEKVVCGGESSVSPSTVHDRTLALVVLLCVTVTWGRVTVAEASL